MKYKIWNNKEHKFVNDIIIMQDGHLAYISNNTFQYSIFKDNNPVLEKIDNLERNHFEIVEYTGIKDMYGIEIYKGDVVKQYGDDTYYLVKYDKDEGCWVADSDTENVIYNLTTNAYKVIGNIYENSYLKNRL